MSVTTQRKQGNRLVWTAVAVVVIVALAAVGLYVMVRARANDAGNSLTFKVASGPLTISVTEPGTIRSRQQEIIKNEVEGVTTALSIIPEGTLVKKGDLLIELDSSKLQDMKVDKQITVQNADASFVQARENLEVVKNQGQADVAKAKLDAQFAEDDLKQYLEGQFPKDQREAQSKIELMKENVNRMAEKLRWSQKLFEEKYLSQTELEADQLASNSAKLDLQTAQGDLDLLQNFTYKRKVAEFKSNIDQTQMALERATRKAAADAVQAEASLKAKDSEFTRQKSQLEKVLEQIEKCRIVAPTDGLVVYATTGQQGFRNLEPLAEGSSVRERQDLIYLPTTSSVVADIKLHESSLEKTHLGLGVRVTVDALPGRVFTGTVAKISPMPDAQSSYQNPDLKVYNTTINIDGDGSQLRTGMSCRAEIVIEQYPNAVYVPVQSVVRIGGRPTVYVAGGKQLEKRPIELGLDNNQWARVISGLKPGESVLMSPPLAEGAMSGQEQPVAEVTPLAPTSQPVVASGDPPTTAPAADGGRNGDTANGGRRRGGGGGDASAGGGRRGAGGGGGDATDGTGGGRRGGRGGAANMTPEDREAMRKRYESMTPEERQKAMEQMAPRRRPADNAGGAEGRAE